MSQFVDECGLNVRGGDGGAGSVSFRREAHVPRGGPDGGDGGSGGDLWLVADVNVASLLAFRDHPHRRATDGKHGHGKRKHGPAGADLIVEVPVGTVARDPETDEVLVDLANPGDRWLAAAGGQGGRGNARFLSNKRRAPGFAEQGEPGEERWLRIDLKLMADVALVGFPNVGKSTLISRVSAAKPAIADYPFTTLQPNLGVVRRDSTEMVVADIPGLIEGASEGRGLGHKFLRHVERARVLVLLLDLAPPDGVPPEEQERVLLAELGNYQPDLLERPRIVVGSRSDMEGAFGTEFPDFDGHRLSSITNQGVDELVGLMAAAVDQARRAEPEHEGFVVHRPEAVGFRVERTPNGSFLVIGRQAERAVALSDITDLDALDYARQRLDSIGVNKALARAGARPGDTIHIGDFAFDYEDD